jgi:arylsulfatase A-like enzyme
MKERCGRQAIRMRADEIPTHAPSTGLPAWTSLAVLVLWFGLVTGLGEAAVRTVCYGLRAEHLFYNEHFLWMTPTAEGILFLAFGIPLGALAQTLLPKAAQAITAGMLSFLATLGIALASGAIYAWCALLLAAGVAWRLSSLTRRRPQLFPTFCRATLPALVGIALALAAAVFGFQLYQDHQGAALGPRPGFRTPNVLLVVLDAVRADALSVYATDGASTPFLDGLARRTLVFESALAPSSWTLPSHATFLTGRYPRGLSVDWYKPLDDRPRTLPEVLREQGFATAGFVGNTKYCPRTSGLRRGFGHYEDFTFGWGEILQHSAFVQLLDRQLGGFGFLGVYDELGRKPACRVTDGFLHWVDGHGPRPFFAMLNYFDAHAPYFPSSLPDPRRTLTHDEKTRLHDLADADWSELKPQAEFLRTCYLAKVHELDAELQRLTEELDGRGTLENTVLIVTADHGEQFGEHGVFSHGNSLYRPVVHVPLLIAWPSRITQGRRIMTPVSLKDLPATILDLLGLSAGDPLPGRSFRPKADAASAGRQEPLFAMLSPAPNSDRFAKTPVARGTMFACLDQGIYLIREADGTLQAFDFLADPRESKDLVGVPEYASRIDTARSALDTCRGDGARMGAGR